MASFVKNIAQDLSKSVGKGFGNVSKGLGNVGKGLGNLVKKNIQVKKDDPIALSNITCLILEIFYEEDLRVKDEIAGLKENNYSKVVNPFTKNEEAKPDDQNRAFSSLHRCNHSFVYYLLNTDLDELHQTYSQFFEEFDDSGKSGLMEQKEFIAMLNLLCKPEYIGKNKLSKCFERLCASCVANSKHIDKLFEGTSNEQLGPNLMNDLFRRFQTEILERGERDKSSKKEVIEYITFFPFIMAFFSEWIARKIETRKEQILMIRGIAEDERMEIAKTSSLLSKIKSLGYSYDEKNPAEINYREIEKALILFRNAYSGKLKTEQLTLILDEVKKKYKYDPRTGTFGKIIKLNLNLLTFIAYRICLHSFCSHISETKKDATAQEYIEEYSAWAGAVNSKRLNQENLKLKFLKVAYKKVEDLEGLFEQDKLRKLFKFFIKRIIPQMPQRDIDNVMTIYIVSTENLAMISLFHFATNIYNLLMYYARIKLGYYIELIHMSVAQKESKSKDKNKDKEKDKDKSKDEKTETNQEVKYKLFNGKPLVLEKNDEVCKIVLLEIEDQAKDLRAVNKKMSTKREVFTLSPQRKTKKFGTTMYSRSPEKKQSQFAFGLAAGLANSPSARNPEDMEINPNPNEGSPDGQTHHEETNQTQNFQANMTAQLQRRTMLVNDLTNRNSFFSAPEAQNRFTQQASTTGVKFNNETWNNNNKDILNSCFIMETFIEKYLFHRKTIGQDEKIFEKPNESSQQEDSVDEPKEKDKKELVAPSPATSLRKRMLMRKQMTSFTKELAKDPNKDQNDNKEKRVIENDIIRNDLMDDDSIDVEELKIVRKVDPSKRKGVCDECNIF